MTGALTAKDIYKRYGEIPVLKDVHIDIAPGTTHAVIGPNGAGKTTLFKVLSGEVFADAGSVEFFGRDVSRMPGHERVRLGIGRTFQVARVFGEMSVLENLVIALESRARFAHEPGVRHFGVSPSPATQAEALRILETVELGGRVGETAAVLAYGERKRLELALALALRPRMLLLDEPMAGMSPGDRLGAVALLKRIAKAQDMAILLTEHDMSVVFALADQVTVLNYGEVIASGPPEQVRASPVVREIYLGHEHA
ncbi:MAG: ABC transporter ATP-binding protein [Variovorax sp.]